jgi:hypothetical protein
VVEGWERVESYEEYCLGEVKLEQKWDQFAQDQHRLNMHRAIIAVDSWNVRRFFHDEFLAASNFPSSHDFKPSIAANFANK